MIDTTPRAIMPRTVAAIDYPDIFPCLQQDGYSMALDVGFVRSVGGVVLPTQRRAYNNLPTVINAMFTVRMTQFTQWAWWVNDHVGLWVNFPLAHPFMLAGSKIEMVPARIIDGQLSKSYVPFGNVNVGLMLQLSPSVFAESALP